MPNLHPKLIVACNSCYIGENKGISVSKDGPIFNSEQLRKFPQFGSYIK